MNPTITLLGLAPLLTTSPRQDGIPDGAHARLQARAEQPAEAGPLKGAEGAEGAVHPGTSLFHMVGGDNAECVRSTPDVTGDGRDEILVGIGESGTDNVFCLDGASRGPASIVWSLQTSDGVSGGSCYGDQSIVPVSDTEPDGRSNALIGTAWGGRTAYDLDTLAGAQAWRFDTYLESASGWVYSLCEISDVTSDGVPEYAFGVGSDNNGLYLVDGAGGGGQASVLWKYAAGDAVYSVRNLGDVNADGTDDVLAAVGDDVDRIVCLEGDSASPGGNVLWTYVPGASVFACGTLTDVSGDGVDEALAVLWVSDGSAIRCLDGTNGNVLWSSTSVGSFGMQAHELEDVTGDGENEIIVSSWDNAVTVLDGIDGSLVWSTTVGTTNGGDVWTARAIDDLDGDGFQDVICGSFDYHVYAMDGETGAVFWAFNTGNRVFSVHSTGDLDGDGVSEVVAGTQDTNSNTVVHVLDGNAGMGIGTALCLGVGCPCANDDPSAGCANSTGNGGELAASGSASVSADDLVLTGTQLPPFNQGLMYMGDQLVNQPFYDGLQCALGTTLRFFGAIQNTGAGGSMTHTGFVAESAGLITSGSTWYFHAWHRDVSGGPCGTGANLTHVLGVTFGP